MPSSPHSQKRPDLLPSVKRSSDSADGSLARKAVTPIWSGPPADYPVRQRFVRPIPPEMLRRVMLEDAALNQPRPASNREIILLLTCLIASALFLFALNDGLI